MHERFDEFMKHTPAVTFIKDEERRIVYSNESYYRCSNPTAEPLGPISRQLSRRDEEVLALGRHVEITETLRDLHGIDRHFLVLKFPFRSAAGVRLLGGVALDVTAKILAEKELEQHAKSDLLTGLTNRRSFTSELATVLDKCAVANQQLAVTFVDLDGFKRVNDRLGHEAGDELLQQVAARLKQVCRGSDMLARLGGDEFTFFLPDTSPAEARERMATVLAKFEDPFRIGFQQIVISASVGLTKHVPG